MKFSATSFSTPIFVASKSVSLLMFRNFTPLFLPSICRRIKSGVFASSSAVFLLIELSVDRTYFGYSSNFLFVNVILLRSLVEVKVRTFSFIRQSSITLTSMVGMLQITFSLLLYVHSGLNTYRCPVRLLNLSRGCFFAVRPFIKS